MVAFIGVHIRRRKKDVWFPVLQFESAQVIVPVPCTPNINLRYFKIIGKHSVVLNLSEMVNIVRAYLVLLPSCSLSATCFCFPVIEIYLSS